MQWLLSFCSLAVLNSHQNACSSILAQQDTTLMTALNVGDAGHQCAYALEQCESLLAHLPWQQHLERANDTRLVCKMAS